MYFWGDFDTDLRWIAKFIPGDWSSPEFEDRTYSFTDIPKGVMNFRMTEEEAEYYKTELYRQVMEKARNAKREPAEISYSFHMKNSSLKKCTTA